MITMKAVIALMSIVALFTLSYFTMVFGWGMEVKSRGWVIGSWFGYIFITAVGKVIE